MTTDSLIEQVSGIIREASRLMARGFAELYFEMRLMPWDYAAAGLILEEAGGAICSLDGNAPSLTKPSLIIAGNNQENCDRILATVRKHLLALPY